MLGYAKFNIKPPTYDLNNFNNKVEKHILWVLYCTFQVCKMVEGLKLNTGNLSGKSNDKNQLKRELFFLYWINIYNYNEIPTISVTGISTVSRKFIVRNSTRRQFIAGSIGRNATLSQHQIVMAFAHRDNSSWGQFVAASVSSSWYQFVETAFIECKNVRYKLSIEVPYRPGTHILTFLHLLFQACHFFATFLQFHTIFHIKLILIFQAFKNHNDTV